jgi:hypothetical protein
MLLEVGQKLLADFVACHHKALAVRLSAKRAAGQSELTADGCVLKIQGKV